MIQQSIDGNNFIMVANEKAKERDVINILIDVAANEVWK